MSFIDRMIAGVSPRWAYSRAQYRKALAAYEAAKPSRLRKTGADNSSGDAALAMAGPALRGYARQLEQNYDVAKSALDVLVNNTIGPYGIQREPQPRRADGTIHEAFADELMALWKEFCQRPEVTREHTYAAAERLAARSWFRDGELLVQLLEGPIASLTHGGRVPLSLELIEADQMPFDLDDDTKGITQGVERNGWGRPVAYHVFKSHPGDLRWRVDLATKRVPADRMLHPKLSYRIRQARGISIFASVLRRLEDLKDYEESERIAARVAAAMTGFIKKGTPDDFTPPSGSSADRAFSMKPGMIFDGLQPGEDVGTIDSNRPSALLEPFHQAMVRCTAGGIGVTYSSLSRNYNGTYSAQRQELVEGYSSYAAITEHWVGMFDWPVWERFVRMAIMSGQIRVPADVLPHTVADAEFFGPAMPWIDPVKEAEGNKIAERAGHKAPQESIRARGSDWRDVYKQIAAARALAEKYGLKFDTDPNNDKSNQQTPANAGVSVSEDEKDAKTV
jgi:lambda family phage portal protein